MTNNKEIATRSLKNFGDNLYRLRTEKNMTREDLAYKVGFESSRIIYDYENGFKYPKVENLLKIVDTLGVNLDSMFR